MQFVYEVAGSDSRQWVFWDGIGLDEINVYLATICAHSSGSVMFSAFVDTDGALIVSSSGGWSTSPLPMGSYFRVTVSATNGVSTRSTPPAGAISSYATLPLTLA